MPDKDWLQWSLLSQIADVPVFTDPSWSPQTRASAYYSTGDPMNANPYIMLRPKYAKRVAKALKGQAPDIGNIASGLRIFANEWAHAQGLDATDVGGFDGGTKHRPVIMSLINKILKQSNLTKKQRKAIRHAAYLQQSGTISNPNPPPVALPPVQTGPIPVIGRTGVQGYA